MHKAFDREAPHSALSVALRFMDIYFRDKNWDALHDICAADMRFTSPLLNTADAQSYINALKSDPPGNNGYTHLRKFTQGSRVCLVYDFYDDRHRVPAAHYFDIRDGKIFTSTLIYDGSLWKNSP